MNNLVHQHSNAGIKVTVPLVLIHALVCENMAMASGGQRPALLHPKGSMVKHHIWTWLTMLCYINVRACTCAFRR